MAFVDNAYNGRVIKEGIMPVRITLDDVCDIGDLLGYDAIVGGSDAWEKADADGKIPAILVAGEQCKTSGDEIVCYKMAYIDFGSGSTATAGDLVYTSDTTGSYAATPGAFVHHCVGQMLDATMAFIFPQSTPLFTHSLTGTATGAYMRTEIDSGRTAVHATSGAKVDLKIISGATLEGDVFGLYVVCQWQDTEAAAEANAVVRLEDNSDASCHPYSFISFQAGGTGPNYMFDIHQPDPSNGAWASAGAAKTGAGGWLKINTDAGDRYINMYTG